MMLKSMRDATERSGLLDSEATKTYESMFDQQMSTELAGKGTFGIAQALQNQLNLNPSKGSRGESMPLSQSRGFELKQGEGSYELQRGTRPLTFTKGDL
jgi:flagellar protein FlgJ